MEVLLEFIDATEVSLACERLLVRATMNRDEIGSSILESLAELYQEWVIFPAEPSLHRYRNLDRLTHLFYDLECSVSIDHERWSMPTLDDFLGRTPHIDIDPRDAISFDDPSCFSEFLWILAKYLDNQGIFAVLMCESCPLQLFRMNESISRIEFWEHNGLRCYPLHDLTIRTITIPVHWRKCHDRSLIGEILPEVFVHIGASYIQKMTKIQLFIII